MTYNPSTAAPQISRSVSNQGVNNTGSTLAQLTPVKLNSSGLSGVSVSVESDIDSLEGILAADLVDGGTGEVYSTGTIQNVTTGFSQGDPVYLSATGGLTNVKPVPGANGFVTGDFVVRLGFIGKNATNMSWQDFVISIERLGQL